MSITEETTETTSRIVVSPNELARALTNAVLFTNKDQARPTLRCVRMQFEAGRVVLESTDSYVLFRETVETDGTTEAVVYVDRDQAANVAKQLKGIKSYGPWAGLELEGNKLNVILEGMTMSVGTEIDLWPNTESLRTNVTSGSLENVCFGGDVLGRISKVKSTEGPGTTGENVRFSFPETNLKPAVVTVGANIDFLVMPVRIP